MNRILWIAAFIASALTGYAQQILQGKVVDGATGNPLPGVTIAFYGKGVTATDKDGAFAMPCEKNIKLTFTSIGYQTAQQNIKNCGEQIIIKLLPISHSLTEVEITATSAQNKSMLYQPASITKLNNTELKRSTGLFLDEAINANVPGVTMNRRSIAGGQQFNIRGYGNGVRGNNGISSNFDGQGYKVYLNGIPVTDAEGITVMDDLDFGSIGNVEVVKGPSGSLYGLAIAGVVNLKTSKPEKGKTAVGQDVLFGSYGLKRFTTHFEMGGDRSSLLVNYGYQHSDGFMVHTASKKKFINIAGDFQLNEKQVLNFYAGYSDSYDERAGELTITQYANKDYSGNPAYIQRNAHSNVVGFRLGIGHTYTFNEHISNTTTVFGTGINNNASSGGGWTDKDPINYGLRSTVDTRFSTGKNISLTGISGIEFQRQNAQVIGYNMKADPPNVYYKIDTMRSNQYYITSTKSLFTEWTLALPASLSLTAGVGLSTMSIDLSDRFVRPNFTRPQNYRMDYTGLVSPHFAVNKVFGKEVSVYAAYSQAYKAPVSSYFFVPVSPSVGFVDSTLVPEKGIQFEIGSKGNLFNDRLSYQLALFHAIFSNKMTAVAVPLNPPEVGTAYTYVANGGKHTHKGIELLLKYTAYQATNGIFRTIRPFANVTYSKFRYEDYKQEKLKSPPTADTTIDYSGNPVAGVAPWVANAGIDILAAAGIYANVVYSYKDAMPFTSDNVNTTKSYSLWNAKLGMQQSLSSHFTIDAFVGVNNIAGTQYPLMVFVNQLPDAYLPGPYKANYFGGVNVRYIF